MSRAEPPVRDLLAVAEMMSEPRKKVKPVSRPLNLVSLRQELNNAETEDDNVSVVVTAKVHGKWVSLEVTGVTVDDAEEQLVIVEARE